MSTWLVPLGELTLEQRNAVELKPGTHRLIKGPPGSGKTIVLLHRAKYLQQIWKIPPERFHIFVFTNVLKDYIKSALNLLDLPDSCVTTFDSWCRNFYKEHISSKLPWNKKEKQTDFDAIREGVNEKLSQNPFDFKLFDFIMIDEGQDLYSVSYEIMRIIGNHLTVFLDYKQQIYDRDCNEKMILKKLGLRKANMTILGAYRCCPYISQLGSKYIDNAKEKNYFLNQVKTTQAEKEKPLLFLASGYDEEFDRLVDVLRTRINKGEKIGILLPTNRLAFGIAKGLKEAGIEVETQKELDFNTDAPKVMTYHKAKGLTFDSVLMPRLVNNAFKKVPDKRREKLLFVAITRAMKWVYLSGTDERKLAELSKILDGKSKESLVIQKAGMQEEVKSRDNIPDDDDDDLLDLL